MTYRFPFGAPLVPCPPTMPLADRCSALVLGVYPSALHVRWRSADGTTGIGSLAVDNEPSVFWDGVDQVARIEAWRQLWFDDSWGTVGPTRLNGSSGAKIDEDVLAPLGLDRESVWFTDAVNTYFVKQRDSQGKAQSGRFHTFADAMSLRRDRRPELPPRPSPSALVRLATTEHRDRLLGEIHASETPLIVTLGNEALATIAGITSNDNLPGKLDHLGYGIRWSVHIDGRAVDVLPLKHPGNRNECWTESHNKWVTSPSPR